MFRIKNFKNWRESGAMIAMTAVMLPMFMMCTGLAFDFGNMYMHKARLQNVADSAALAGGRVYAHESDKDLAHPQSAAKSAADAEAKIYADKNMNANKLGGEFSDEKYQVKASDDAVYYRVKLSENVPVYFLRLFMPNTKSQSISADAVVAIGEREIEETKTTENTETIGEDGNDLFIFRKNFHAVNTIENPDNFNSNGQITTTFDGRIAFTDGSGDDKENDYKYDYLQYSTQTDGMDYFFTSKARDEGKSVNSAIAGGDEYAHKELYVQFDMDDLGKSTKETMGLPDYVAGVDWGAIDWSKSVDWNSINAKQAAANEYSNNSKFDGKKDMRSSDLSKNVAWTAHNGDGNVSITIDGKISGDANDPVYVYLDESIYQVNFDIKASNERPLVLVYEGTGKLQMNMSSGNTFRGIVYAPNVNEGEGVLINSNGGTFKGSIIANAINLQGGRGTYIHENFGVNGSHSKTTKTTTTTTTTTRRIIDGNSKVKLSNPNVSWD